MKQTRWSARINWITDYTEKYLESDDVHFCQDDEYDHW